MKIHIRTYLIMFFFQGLGACIFHYAVAQKMQYSSGNALVNYPDQLNMVANIAGNHHLLAFTRNEHPMLFIFDADLRLKGKITIPFKFIEKSNVQIISLSNSYYLFIHPPLGQHYVLWKVDANGILTDLSDAFLKLIQSHKLNARFHLIENQDKLCILHHSYLEKLKKYRTSLAELDSSLQVVFTRNVLYDTDGGLVQKEMFINEKEYLILKTGNGGSTLEIMKVNLASGYVISNTFKSSGYIYTLSGFNYDATDNSITIYSMLQYAQNSSKIQHSVFISKLDTSLVEKHPFTILKSQFSKNTYANYLLVDGGASKWICLKPDRVGSQEHYTTYENVATPYRSRELNRTYGNEIIPLQDFTSSNSNASIPSPFNDPPVIMKRVDHYATKEDPVKAIRFTLLDKTLQKASDSLITNTQKSYGIVPDQFSFFESNHKNYLVVGQHFNNKNGLLLVSTQDGSHLTYRTAMVNDNYNYLVSQAEPIPNKGMILPYIYKREAGLMTLIPE